MIDIENRVYDTLAKRLRAKFKGISTGSEYPNEGASFPFVYIVMQNTYRYDNSPYNTLSRELDQCLFQINIFSNKTNGKKTECKKILHEVDDCLVRDMGFKRTSCTPVPNMDDANIYRIVANYEVITDGVNLYRKG